jgi:hypothetical protein
LAFPIRHITIRVRNFVVLIRQLLDYPFARFYRLNVCYRHIGSCSGKFAAVARPRPLAPPVMRTDLPLRLERSTKELMLETRDRWSLSLATTGSNPETKNLTVGKSGNKSSRERIQEAQITRKRRVLETMSTTKFRNLMLYLGCGVILVSSYTDLGALR